MLLAAIVSWHPIASLVTMVFSKDNTFKSSGIAVISLDFSSVFTWPKTRLFSLAQVLTMWIGDFFPPDLGPLWSYRLWLSLLYHSEQLMFLPIPQSSTRIVHYQWQKMPDWRSREKECHWEVQEKFAGKSSFSRAYCSISFQVFAPQITEIIPIRRMSSNLWSLVKSRLGSSIWSKISFSLFTAFIVYIILIINIIYKIIIK